MEGFKWIFQMIFVLDDMFVWIWQARAAIGLAFIAALLVFGLVKWNSIQEVVEE